MASITHAIISLSSQPTSMLMLFCDKQYGGKKAGKRIEASEEI